MSMGAKAWVLAARPKTLSAGIVPVWAGCVLGWKLRGVFEIRLALATLAATVCIQVATNFFNDAIDADKGADTSRRLGPVRVTASGLMSRRAVLGAGFLFLVLACLAALPLLRERGWIIMALGAPCLFLAYGYTGGPFPLAYLGLGELFVVLFFGLVAVMGTVFVQTGAWLGEAAWLGLALGSLSAVLISINNLRDVEEDTTSGKRTLAVRWGWRRARWLVAGEVLLAGLALVPVLRAAGVGGGRRALVLGFVALYGGGLARAVCSREPSRLYNRLLMAAGMLLLGFGALWHGIML